MRDGSIASSGQLKQGSPRRYPTYNGQRGLSDAQRERLAITCDKTTMATKRRSGQVHSTGLESDDGHLFEWTEPTKGATTCVFVATRSVYSTDPLVNTSSVHSWSRINHTTPGRINHTIQHAHCRTVHGAVYDVM